MEEIIIDGVNVAGCVRLQDDKISCDLGGECKGWENCYYKQLKRLEQENARLKEERCKKCDFQKQYFAETKKLLDINHKLRLGCLKCEYKNTKADVDKYKQTLQEIKGVATALYMNNWLQMNETARKSIQLLQELITKAEEE